MAGNYKFDGTVQITNGTTIANLSVVGSELVLSGASLAAPINATSLAINQIDAENTAQPAFLFTNLVNSQVAIGASGSNTVLRGNIQLGVGFSLEGASGGPSGSTVVDNGNAVQRTNRTSSTNNPLFKFQTTAGGRYQLRVRITGAQNQTATSEYSIHDLGCMVVNNSGTASIPISFDGQNNYTNTTAFQPIITAVPPTQFDPQDTIEVRATGVTGGYYTCSIEIIRLVQGFP